MNDQQTVKKNTFVFDNFFSKVMPFMIWHVEPDRPQMTAGQLLLLWWTTMAKNINPEFIILIVFYGNSG